MGSVESSYPQTPAQELASTEASLSIGCTACRRKCCCGTRSPLWTSRCPDPCVSGAATACRVGSSHYCHKETIIIASIRQTTAIPPASRPRTQHCIALPPLACSYPPGDLTHYGCQSYRPSLLSRAHLLIQWTARKTHPLRL
jgi:hypothetical protein